MLRTHTTAATIRALSRNPDPPGKYFCVGWTFRNETISFKHLPVFHQVDGIVIDERDAALAAPIRDLGLAVSVTDTIMTDRERAAALARELLALAEQLR